MPKQRCGQCGREEWPEKLRFCETCQMWVCVACFVILGMAATAIRCPRCYHSLGETRAAPIG